MTTNIFTEALLTGGATSAAAADAAEAAPDLFFAIVFK